jgi:phage terminase small subunit
MAKKPAKRTKKSRAQAIAVDENRELTTHEDNFCREYILCGEKAAEAYRKSGLCKPETKDASVWQAASRLLMRIKVQSRIQELKAQAFEKSQLSVEAVVAELAKLAFSNMLDYVRVDSEGLAAVDLSKLTRDQAAAISEITSEELPRGKDEDGEPIRIIKTKIKTADKHQSLQTLLKHMTGVLGEKAGDTNNTLNIIAGKTDLELAREIAFLLMAPTMKKQGVPT